MTSLLLGPMLRHVSETTATVWVETDAAATVTVLGHDAHTFHVRGHHYALVIVEGLAPGSETPYEVHLDGVRCWPHAGSDLPPSTIRTVAPGQCLKLLFGSCRAAGPHDDAEAAEGIDSQRIRGVDAFRAHGLRMMGAPSAEWPQLFVLLGDQIYADDCSAEIAERALARPGRDPELPPGAVADFEEYTWLYHETWTPTVERWMFSVVPSVMIFDDHDMIDDWNISEAWVQRIRATTWGPAHIIAGLMSYWVYQQLGNLAPDQIHDEGLLDALSAVPDGYDTLQEWALRSEEFTPLEGGYRFSYHRDLGRVRLIMVDCRNGRVLDRGERAMVDEKDSEWLRHCCDADVDHLLVGTTLPVLLPQGLHDLQVWNERVCDGVWGRWGARLGERLRCSLDLEDWSSFSRSFTALLELLADTGGRTPGKHPPPETIAMLSGDIHLSYRARATFPSGWGVRSRVYQLVSSPIRNELDPWQRRTMQVSCTAAGRLVGRALRRGVRRRRPEVSWAIEAGPMFGNAMSVLTLDGRRAHVAVEQTVDPVEGVPDEHDVLAVRAEADL